MKINIIVGLLFLFFLSSCCGTHTEVTYSYAGVTISRVDGCGKTTFYYQKGTNRTLGIIWAEYSGINDGFSGYLKFYPNGKVELLSGDGYFQSKEVDSTLFEYKEIYAYNRPELEKSVCVINLSTSHEQEQNKQFASGVEFGYNVDTNDWW